MKLDEKDKIIISMFSKDPDISQEEIAREVGISQPSVAVRIRKLKEKGAIVTQTGLDPFKMGLYLAKVDINTNNSVDLLNMFRGCPFFANGFTVSGKYNLSLIFISENLAALEALVNNHIRSNESVIDVDFNILINSEKTFIVPTILAFGDNKDPPCKTHLQCGDCASFIAKRCTGCPATGENRGWLF